MASLEAEIPLGQSAELEINKADEPSADGAICKGKESPVLFKLLPLVDTQSCQPNSEEKSSVKGGKAWRQMQADSQILRLYQIKLTKLIGGGTINSVYLAEDHSNTFNGKPTKLAVKVLDWSAVPGVYQRAVYRRLMSLYEQLPSHPNILQVRSRIVDGANNYLLTEYCANGSLRRALGPEGCLERGVAEGRARDFLLQICAGLLFLQNHDLPHGRLTSENVLLDADFNVRLSDFGYPPSCGCNGTDDEFHLLFRAPELLQQKPYTGFVADIWSLGIVFYSLLHGSLPYSKRDVALAERTFNMPPLQFRTSLTFPCQLLVKRLLNFSPMFRPTLASVLQDPWLLETRKGPEKRHPSCFQDQAPSEQLPKTEGEIEDNGQCFTSPHSFDTGLASSSPSPQRQPTADFNEKQQQAEHEAGDRGPEHFPTSGTSTKSMHLSWKLPVNSKQLENYKRQQMEELKMKSRAKTALKRPKKRKEGPRIAYLFARYNPCPLEENTTLEVMESDNRDVARWAATAAEDPSKETQEQLTKYLNYSEAIRMKFVRYYAGVIPHWCKEFPLPPLLVTRVKRKGNLEN